MGSGPNVHNSEGLVMHSPAFRDLLGFFFLAQFFFWGGGIAAGIGGKDHTFFDVFYRFL